MRCRSEGTAPPTTAPPTTANQTSTPIYGPNNQPTCVTATTRQPRQSYQSSQCYPLFSESASAAKSLGKSDGNEVNGICSQAPLLSHGVVSGCAVADTASSAQRAVTELCIVGGGGKRRFQALRFELICIFLKNNSTDVGLGTAQGEKLGGEGEESWSGLEADGTADDGRSGGRQIILRRQRQRTSAPS